ncbi:MAG: DUF3096 domain-containing protein [Nanoarchaeota archaeon]|nr:DUF3096 domain-containing protein [Nanoarchaeota archaeon]MBU4085946.1 DUF3096 domain-containing protein [Nanoarchaeota archaeon]
MSLTISAGLAILFGLLILLFPKLLRWGVGLYLLIWGIIQIVANYI